MKVGDRVFFYHSVKERRIVGITEVVREAYPDPSDPKERFVQVDLKALEAMPEPVTLAQIKADERLQEIALVRQSRLSVMPIPAEAWQIICEFGQLRS